MPRIAKRFLDCVVYIYPDEKSALSDQGFGGSGFVVARHVSGGYQTFVVTNRHVIEGALDPVIRLNRVSGGTESFPTNRSWWKHHPEGDDLSAYQLDISAYDHRQAWIWQNGFLTRDIWHQYLGLGSDVAMLGRFIGLNGLVTNTPVARFGSIAAPNVIEERNTFQSNQETFVVDCQSVPGFSGSPVIAFLPTTALAETAVENSGLGPWLLGVDWMHFGNPERVLSKDSGLEDFRPYIKGNSGLMGVIPAWRISALLDEFEESVTGNFHSVRDA
jgi:Trypsin-like peptidase domain